MDLQMASNELTIPDNVIEKEKAHLLCSQSKTEHVYFDIRKFH